jgi:molecular chaperone GrpE
MGKKDDIQENINEGDEEEVVVEESAIDSTDDKTAKLQEELDELNNKFEQLQNQFKRAVADYHNLEKRIAEGRSEMTTWATTDLIQRLLPVLDYYDKALKGVGETDRQSGWLKGVEMATMQFKQVLKDEGLEQVEADGTFDPSLHEAIDTKEGVDGKILEVIDNGYKLKGKVVRPARVVVGRKGE